MENKFVNTYSADQVEFMFNMTRKNVGNIKSSNIDDYEKLEMYLLFKSKINKRNRGCSCNWKGLHSKLTKLIPQYKDDITEAHNFYQTLANS